VRDGASPSQKGTVGGAPPASCTRTTPGSIFTTCHEAFAELEHVASAGFDGEVLVQGPDERAFGLDQHAVVRVVGDGTTGRQRREPRALGSHQAPAHAVAMQQRRASVRVHLDHAIEVGARELAVRSRAAERFEELVLLPLARGAVGHHLLREDVERRTHVRGAIEATAAHGAQERHGFDGLVERQRVNLALGRARDAVTGASDALQERRDRARAAHLHGEVDVADVDAELERRRRDEHRELAGFEPCLRGEARLLRQAPVVARHATGAQLFGEARGESLGELARAHEHERRAVRANRFRHLRVQLGPLLVAAHRGERRVGQHGLELHRAQVTRVDELAPSITADEQARHRRERLHGRGETDALRRTVSLFATQCFESLERECEMRAALVARDRVDLVDDHGAHGPAASRVRRCS
jgi:hypothetical protein